MAERILVPLRRDDRIEEIIPYLEKIAQPAMRVVFLLHYPIDGLEWLQAHVATMETGMREVMVGTRIASRQSMEQQKRLAKARILLATTSLEKLGVEASVDVHAGPLRKVLKTYALGGDVHMIMMPGRRTRWMAGLRVLGTLRFHWFAVRSSLSPIVLVHPGALV